MDHSRICFYISDMGATTSADLVARQEMPVFPFISLMKQFDIEDRKFRREFKKIDGNTFKCNGVEYDIKDYVYF